jgi:hypothetical protein
MLKDVALVDDGGRPILDWLAFSIAQNLKCIIRKWNRRLQRSHLPSFWSKEVRLSGQGSTNAGMKATKREDGEKDSRNLHVL